MRKRLFAAIISGVIVALTPAASSGQITVRPLSEVNPGGPPQLVNVGPKSAGLTFKSKIPLACTVVYGKTKSFGMIANDPAMGSVATIDHNPVIGKLEPGVKYYFRVQGASVGGVFYAGKLRSFTTPAKAAGPAGLVAVAAKVMAVSSNYGDGANNESWGADSAVDGDPSTAWSSDGDGGKACLEVDFGKPMKLGAIDVWTRTMSDGTAQIFSFKVTTDTGKSFGPFTLPDAKKSHRFPLETTARTLRIVADKTSGGNTGLVEFVAYGKAKQ